MNQGMKSILKQLLLGFGCLILFNSLHAQISVRQKLEKNAKKITDRLLKRILDETWTEYKRVYHVRGTVKEYNYGGQRYLIMNSDSTVWQSDNLGNWTVSNDYFLSLYNNNINTDEVNAGKYVVYKANRNELVLAKPLTNNFNNKIVYYYRKVMQLPLAKKMGVDPEIDGAFNRMNLMQYTSDKPDMASLKKMKKYDLVRLVQYEYFVLDVTAPRNLEKKEKEEIVEILTNLYEFD